MLLFFLSLLIVALHCSPATPFRLPLLAADALMLDYTIWLQLTRGFGTSQCFPPLHAAIANKTARGLSNYIVLDLRAEAEINGRVQNYNNLIMSRP